MPQPRLRLVLLLVALWWSGGLIGCGGVDVGRADGGLRDGRYVGQTSQGETITVVVEDGRIAAWRVLYRCEEFISSDTQRPSDCELTGGRFACGETFCRVFETSSALEATPKGPNELAGTIDIGHRPDLFRPCCRLAGIPWSARREGA